MLSGTSLCSVLSKPTNMITKVSDSVKNNIASILITILITVLLTGFCYYVNYSLLIPIFLLFLGIHLKFCQKGSYKSLLNLGLLLSLIVFTTNIIIQYAAWSPYYVPVAGIAMLTMLLF